MALAEREHEDDWVPADTFASRLRAIRFELGLTQEEAASKCGINPKTWATWELPGDRSPRNMARVAQQIHDGLKVSRNYVLYGSIRCFSVSDLPTGAFSLELFDENGEPIDFYGRPPLASVG